MFLLVFIGIRFDSFVGLVKDYENARAAFYGEQSSADPHEYKNLNAALSIESSLMQLMYYGCLLCVMISIISGFLSMRNAGADSNSRR